MTSGSSPRARLQIANLADQETVYQRCLLVIGACHDYVDAEDFVAVRARDGFGRPANQQNWPAANGSFKCLVMLQPGPNKIDFELHHRGDVCGSQRLIVNYQPLLQLPPLHLAIMVAKDSPLIMDCPPAKRGAISSAHSSLDAAIVKLRMAAYMWQALLAEDLRLRNLGRRSFRLDEEWGLDTTTASSLQCDPSVAKMDAVAKVHVIRSEKTVAELRDVEVAQQNHRARRRDDLYKYFEQALAAHGSPFISTSRPVVAGMILDTHYSIDQSLILAHAAIGRHTQNGLSLGITGSHTAYAWPRFMEEIPSCLLDLTLTGDAVANDRGQCSNMQGACSFGQAGMLEEVQRAFGASDVPGVKNTTYAKAWTHAFLSCKNGPKEDIAPSLGWGLQGALQAIMTAPHFRLPGDSQLTPTQLASDVEVRCVLNDDDEPCLEVTCLAGLARVRFTNLHNPSRTVKEIDFCSKPAGDTSNTINVGPTKYLLSTAEIEREFERSETVGIEALSMHGRLRSIRNLWQLLADTPFIRVPGTTLVLSKRSVKAAAIERDETSRSWWQWALLLKRRHREGGGSRLAFANRIDLRIGATMDGAVVHYSDGSRCNCGVATQDHYGGHQHEDRTLTEAEVFGITRVSVNKGSRHGWGSLDGCRITHENGEAWGVLNNRGNDQNGVQHLVCAADERIIGFYGRSAVESGFTFEFGIITAPRSVVDSEEGLPREVFTMPELMNTNGGQETVQDPGTDNGSDSDSDSEMADEDADDN
ncbi:putative peptidase family-domain-containing protein [Biscogniauxia sp. FL1348]|nr:putative peptidase family-domain-containing protein [Biscogniauxia sp. FL1348]